MEAILKVHDISTVDRNGIWTSIWAVYYGARVMTVEFTRGKSGLTERVDLKEAEAA